MFDTLLSLGLWLMTVVAVWTLVSCGLFALWCGLVAAARMREDRPVVHDHLARMAASKLAATVTGTTGDE